MHPDDKEKTAFVTEWGVFVAVVMMFGLKTAPATFQRIILEVFGKTSQPSSRYFWTISRYTGLGETTCIIFGYA